MNIEIVSIYKTRNQKTYATGQNRYDYIYGPGLRRLPLVTGAKYLFCVAKKCRADFLLSQNYNVLWTIGHVDILHFCIWRDMVDRKFWKEAAHFTWNTFKSMPPQNTSKSKKQRVMLNEELAIEIYKCKLLFSGQHSKGKSVPVSRIYKISPKTVRDIWNQKTWSSATSTIFSTCQITEVRTIAHKFVGPLFD